MHAAITRRSTQSFTIYKYYINRGSITENETETSAFLTGYYKTEVAFAGHVFGGSIGVTLLDGKDASKI